MPIRVAMLAAECEPWAKTGGLGDMVDALARALGRVGGRRSDASAIGSPVDVFLPRYRFVPEPPPGSIVGVREVRVPDPRSPAGSSLISIVDVDANGYRLRLVDHPVARHRPVPACPLHDRNASLITALIPSAFEQRRCPPSLSGSTRSAVRRRRPSALANAESHRKRP